MKYVTLLLFALAVLCTGAAQARDIKEMAQIIKKPIEIPGGSSARMSVMFPHTAHKGINCMHCHHEVGGDSRYVACTECHSTPGARERDSMSMFMAFHAKDTDRSCYGCHTKKALENPAKYGEKFKGCRPCHMAPSTRAAVDGDKK